MWKASNWKQVSCPFNVVARVQAMLLQSSLHKKMFLISGEKQSESAPTDISLPGVQKNIMNKFMQYIYQVISTLPTESM